MVMLVWFILSLCGVCDFTWLPVFIDAILAAILLAAKEENNLGRDLLCIVAVGVAGFAFYKFFFDLAISAWWILASPIATFVVMLFPGGFTIANYLFKNLTNVFKNPSKVLELLNDVKELREVRPNSISTEEIEDIELAYTLHSKEGLSNRQIAKELGVSDKTIGKWIRQYENTLVCSTNV